MKKILVVCGNGLGTSLMIEGNVKTICKEIGLNAEVGHEDLSSASSNQADVWVAMSDIADHLIKMNKKNVIGLKNIMDKETLRQELSKHI